MHTTTVFGAGCQTSFYGVQAQKIDAERQGPLAALQITGTARDLVRELSTQNLRDGGHGTAQGRQMTGLMLLAQTLCQRYMPMDSELSTRALAELMSFSRMQDEAVDACLVRFDVLRNRALRRGGLGMGFQGYSWLLLKGLRLRPDMWDRLLIGD